VTAPEAPGASPSEQEVRSLVTRVVDAVLEDAPGAAAVSPATAEPRPDSGPAAPVAASSGVIAIGADHGGYALKERLGFRLKEAGHTVVDCGTDSHDSVDYPDVAHAVAAKVASGECEFGVIIDGAGIGSAMVANKVPGVRAALCYDLSTARNSREHNHANVLTLGAGLIGDGLAWQIVQEWLSVPWGTGRHARRVGMITALEQRYTK
jgi:ribose 5-phosphate isomerase B